MHKTAPSLIDRRPWIIYIYWIKQTIGACSRVHSINQRHSEWAALQVQLKIFTFRSLHECTFRSEALLSTILFYFFFTPAGQGLCRRDLNTKTKQHYKIIFFSQYFTIFHNTSTQSRLSTRTVSFHFKGRLWRITRTADLSGMLWS